MVHRPRRLRSTPSLRDAISETQLQPSKLILPLFVTEGKGVEIPQKNLPSVSIYSLDRAMAFLKNCYSNGIRNLLLFGVSSKKDSRGSYALREDSIIVQAIKKIRDEFPDITVGTDIALDPYTDHGHDGLYDGGYVINDATVEVLCEMSLLHARAGAHMVAPSDMMDGRIGAIRKQFENNGFSETLIMAYSAKYASSLYGPFRQILDVNVKGDKKTYQMDPRNRREAWRELSLDLKEGADIVLVKPATWYLDVISDFREKSNGIPVAAYHVSGEAAMIEAAAKSGAIDRNRAILESAHSIFRAGADLLVTYFAPELVSLSEPR